MSSLPKEEDIWRTPLPPHSKPPGPAGGKDSVHAPGAVAPARTRPVYLQREPTATRPSTPSSLGHPSTSAASLGNDSVRSTSWGLACGLADRISAVRLEFTRAARHFSTTPVHPSVSSRDALPATSSQLLSATGTYCATDGPRATASAQDVTSTTLPSISTLGLPLPGSSGDAWQDTRGNSHDNQYHPRASCSHTASGHNIAHGHRGSLSRLRALPSSAASEITSLSESMTDLAASNFSAMERQRVEHELTMLSERLHDALQLATENMRFHYDFLEIQAQEGAESREVRPPVHDEHEDDDPATYTIDPQAVNENLYWAHLGEPMHSSFLDHRAGICLLYGNGSVTEDYVKRLHKTLWDAKMAYEDCVARRAEATHTTHAVPSVEQGGIVESVEDGDDPNIPPRPATSGRVRRQRTTRSATVGRDMAAGPGSGVPKRRRKRPTRPKLTAADVEEERLKFEQQRHNPEWLEDIRLKNQQQSLHHPPAENKHRNIETESYFAAYPYQHPSKYSHRGKSKIDAANTTAREDDQVEYRNIEIPGSATMTQQAAPRAMPLHPPRRPIVALTTSFLRPDNASELLKGKDRAAAP